MASRPDIILLVLDTQRRDRLSCYGYERETSPALDRLAGEATRFERAFAAAQWTIPSHASMFTGLYPSSHNTVQSFDALPASLPTLAERLREGGYYTAAFCNNPLVGVVNNGLRRGFTSFLNYSGLLTSRPNQAGARPGLLGRSRQRFKRLLAEALTRVQDSFARSEALLAFAFTPLMVPLWQTALSFKGNTPRSLADAARLLIGRRGLDRDQPVFCFINLMGVHTPYHPRHEMLARFAPWLLRDRSRWRYIRRFNSDVFGWLAPFTTIDHEQRAMLSDIYDAEVAGQDDYVGAFLDQLRATGALDRSLLIVCADHGEHLGEKGLVGHTISAYNELIHVPLLVRDPQGDFAPATTRRDNVSTRRLFHTMLSAAGLASAIERDMSLARVDGEPAGAIFAEAAPLQNVLNLMLRSQPERVRQFGYDQARRVVIAGDHKLIQTGPDRVELFDLNEDLAERTNLADLLPERVDELQEQLAFFGQQAGALAYTAGQVEVNDDALVRRRLRDLGYLE